ncbi:MAG: LemA family protein [Bacteroidales bacterium]
MKLSKGWIILIVVVLAVLLLFSWGQSSYNSLVTNDQVVQQQWAQVENVYQRRSDLIPNLVNTVKGVANFEQKTLTDVIEARANATKVTISPKNLDEASLQRFQSAQDNLSSTLSRLMMVTENYPQLKATQNFSELQSQLEGTENRITVERMKFNQVVQDYNIQVKRFPSNIFAGMFGFKEKAFFKAVQGAEKAPEVKF